MSYHSLILASSSPYRRELLSRLRLAFTVKIPDIDETPFAEEFGESLALRLAKIKAETVSEQYPESLVIGSDQVLVCREKILGKPLSYDRAVEQLNYLSGQVAVFYTAVSVHSKRSGFLESALVPTQVTFRPISLEKIENYLKKEPAYDCAGSAKAEGFGIALMQEIKTEDPTALIGLPLITLVDLLQKAGVSVL